MSPKARNITEGFCERLKVIKGGESNTEFAKKCDILESTLRSYLSGKSLPSIEKAAIMAKMADADLTWLITGKKSNSLAYGQNIANQFPYYHIEILSDGYNLTPIDGDIPLSVSSQKLKELGMDEKQAALIKMHSPIPYSSPAKDVLFLAIMGQVEICDNNLYIFTLGERIFVKRLKYSLKGFEVMADNPEEKSEFLSFTELEKTPLKIIARIKAIFYAFD